MGPLRVQTWEQAAAVIADADDIAVTDELVTLVTVASTDERYAIHIVAVPISTRRTDMELWWLAAVYAIGILIILLFGG